jgi:hypothetical protein
MARLVVQRLPMRNRLKSDQRAWQKRFTQTPHPFCLGSYAFQICGLTIQPVERTRDLSLSKASALCQQEDTLALLKYLLAPLGNDLVQVGCSRPRAGGCAPLDRCPTLQ